MNSAPASSALTSTDRFSSGDKQAARIVYPAALAAPTGVSATWTAVGTSSANVRIAFTTDANTAYVEVTRVAFYTSGSFGPVETVSTSQTPADVGSFNDYYAPRSGVQYYRYTVRPVSFYTTSSGSSRAYKGPGTDVTVTF